MRTALFTLLLACMYLLPAQPLSTVVIRGSLSPTEDSLVWLRDAAPFPASQPVASAPVSETGAFMLEWEIDGPRLAYLYQGDQQILLFLHPGELLELEGSTVRSWRDIRLLDASLGQADNEALWAFHQKISDLPDFREQVQQSGTLPAYMRTLRNYDRAANEVWETLRDTSTQSEAFVAYMDSRMYYLRNALTLLGPQGIARRNGLDPNSIELPANLIPPPHSDLLNRPELLFSPEYRLFVSTYMNYRLAQWPTPVTPENWVDVQFQLLSESLQDEVLTFEAARVLSRVFKSSQPTAADLYFEDFSQLPGASRYLPYLKGLRETRIRLAPGEEAPAFGLSTQAGEQHRLVDHLGKVVYLVFWEEGMSRPKRLFSAVEDLCGAFKDQEVIVWMIGMGVSDGLPNSLTGLPNLRHDRTAAAPNDLSEAYGLSQFPAFVLIAPDGSILSSVAPEPGSAELTSLIEAILQRMGR